ncbi:ring finger domain containing protein [Nitzschia inconspicua]|uniref:Ring finger domain containing protein n=1 Tax=Nitzschia inconspicua TaxID=303405 RepID=A0A9K3KCN5_9STRA|nr:ring finger domain containing protein [Nitzschia inconspicua]
MDDTTIASTTTMVPTIITETIIPTETLAPDPPPMNTASDNRGAYEFVAFILWYMFLVLCCIVPTCCAYRRRRMLETRYGFATTQQQQQQAALALEQIQQWQQAEQLQNGLFLLPSLQQRQDLIRSVQDMMESDTAKAELTRRLEASLNETTFVVKEGNVIEGHVVHLSRDVESPQVDEKTETYSPNERNMDDDDDDDDDDPKVMETAVSAMEYPAAIDMEVTSTLQLPSLTEEGREYVNASRTVPGVCAICLCGYEVGDKVTWSKLSECQHVFHHECIVPWLAKKNEGQPKCPCCRQAYCNIEPIALADLMSSHNNNNTATRETRVSTASSAMTPLEFMMAIRSGGGGLYFPHETRRDSNGAVGTPAMVVSHHNSPYSSTVTVTDTSPPVASSLEEMEAGRASTEDGAQITTTHTNNDDNNNIDNQSA